MSRGAAPRLLMALALISTLASTGCNYSSANLPYASLAVYRAAAEEALPMQPARIDDEAMHIYGTRTDYSGNQLEYEISVAPGFVPNTCTINVRMEQVKPEEKRLVESEQQFIEKVKSRVQSAAAPPEQ